MLRYYSSSFYLYGDNYGAAYFAKNYDGDR